MADRQSALARGKEALARGAWGEARAGFAQALVHGDSAEAQDGLAWAAWWQCDADAVIEAREAAFRLYRLAGDDLNAARMAMWVATDYADFRGELSSANGWRQRARRLLDELPPAPEHGWASILEGDAALLLNGDTTTAKRCADDATSLGRQLAVVDFGILGLALKGLALVSEGEINAGMKMLDEAAVSALGERLEQPFWVSWALCYLLFACERAKDFDRALEWCDRLREFTERFYLGAGLGVCRVHFAAVMIWRGQWREAEEQLASAANLLQKSRPPWAAEATVRLAELRRRQGRLDEAAEIFGQVEWHPLAVFGLAELALDTGKLKDAKDLAERSLRHTPEASRCHRAEALELLVRAEALLGNHAAAAAALGQLEALSDAIASPPLKASTRFSAGIMTAGAGDYETARVCFEDAIALFERSKAPYEAGLARLELASVLVTLNRVERAAREATAARETLERLGSMFHARRAALVENMARRKGLPKGDQGGDLTNRQRDILRLISQGKNDREIAGALGLSEHTVHRHVANILTRLDMPTRAAATAHAASHGLI